MRNVLFIANWTRMDLNCIRKRFVRISVRVMGEITLLLGIQSLKLNVTVAEIY